MTAPTVVIVPTATETDPSTATITISTVSTFTRTFVFGGQCIAFGQPCPAFGGNGGSTRCCQSALGVCANPLGPGNVGVCILVAEATAFF